MYLCTLKTIGMTGQKTPTALGTEKIGKLLMQYAIPAIIAMTASSLYNMVDSIFIGHGVGPMAISGLALTFPLMNLAAAFGSLVGVGAATLISVKLGQKDYDTAQRVLGNVLVLNIIIGLAFTILTLIFLDPILYFFGGSDETVGYARDYMKVILYGNVITHIYLGYFVQPGIRRRRWLPPLLQWLSIPFSILCLFMVLAGASRERPLLRLRHK